VGALGRVREASIKEMYGEAYQKKIENPKSFEEYAENFNFKALLNEDANNRPLRVMLMGDINVGKVCIDIYSCVNIK
jgi:hypothetical protein